MLLAAGSNIVMFTFPILFLALLGCVFLHLGKKLNDYKMERCVACAKHGKCLFYQTVNLDY